MAEIIDVPDEVKAEIEGIAEEEKKTFNLKDRLHNRRARNETVTVYTDEVTGDELGGARDVRGQLGQVIGRRRWGVLGDIDLLKSEIEIQQAVITSAPEEANDTREKAQAVIDEKLAEIEVLKDKARPLIRTLNQSGLTFRLRSLPPVIKKDAKRQARKSLGITKKGLPEGVTEEDLGERTVAHLFVASVIDYTDHESGQVIPSIDLDGAIELQGHLPEGQWDKIDEAIGSLQYKSAIGDAVTDDADFSPAT